MRAFLFYVLLPFLNLNRKTRAVVPCVIKKIFPNREQNTEKPIDKRGVRVYNKTNIRYVGGNMPPEEVTYGNEIQKAPDSHGVLRRRP